MPRFLPYKPIRVPGTDIPQKVAWLPLQTRALPYKFEVETISANQLNRLVSAENFDSDGLKNGHAKTTCRSLSTWVVLVVTLS